MTKPKLKCRFYEDRYPDEGSVVMGEVKTVEGNLVSVWLVEYRKRSTLILSPESIRVLKVGRQEPFRVETVNVVNRKIVLAETSVPLPEVWDFEKRFNEAKFVYSVIFSVADDMKMNLKDAFKLAAWPTYDKLKTLHSDEAFLACENVPFRTQLIARIALMKYRSWRIKNPKLLQKSFLKQLHDICYAIALTRQAEAFFKDNGSLAIDANLSVQDVLNKAVDEGLVSRDYTISEIEPLVKALKEEGFILETECPLTYSREGTTSEDSKRVNLFKVPQMKVVDGEDVEDGSMHIKLLDELEDGPITCSVVMFPSYLSISKKSDEIYCPTMDEYDVYRREKDEGKKTKNDLHTMLLTGDGVDRHGTHFLEFQDSLGDIHIGDRGFVRFAVDPNTVTEYVYFRDFYDHDDY